jgi:hypothetical protein
MGNLIWTFLFIFAGTAANAESISNQTPVVGDLTWVVPSDVVPDEATVLPSNNNLSMTMHNGRLYLAWRTAPTHFASKLTQMQIISSDDLGQSWRMEKNIVMGTDMREPSLISIGGKLVFHYFEAGSDPLKFEPKHIWQLSMDANGQWSEPTTINDAGEVPWEVFVRNGKAWMGSYEGAHYSAGKSQIAVHFRNSTDGLNWSDVDPKYHDVYVGGVSEVGFDFDQDGRLWGVTRDEDGDDTGFGSHVISSADDSLAHWIFPATADREIYESPRMFHHGSELYLVARRDIHGPYDKMAHWFPFDIRKWFNLASYSLRIHRTSLYHLNRETRAVEWIQDLPSAGDTAFPSIVQLDDDHYLIANYTSPLNKTRWTWITGQTSKRGTGIYILPLSFQ